HELGRGERDAAAIGHHSELPGQKPPGELGQVEGRGVSTSATAEFLGNRRRHGLPTSLPSPTPRPIGEHSCGLGHGKRRMLVGTQRSNKGTPNRSTTYSLPCCARMTLSQPWRDSRTWRCGLLGGQRWITLGPIARNERVI